MCRQNKRKPAGWTSAWQRAYFAAASTAEVATPRGTGVARTKALGGLDDSAGKPHHE